MQVMKTRAEFLACARGRRVPAGGFLLQARDRGDDDPSQHVGFTASKKTGNAVVRNRAKRRMRDLAREAIATQGRPGWDYVLIARPGVTVSKPYHELQADLARALAKVHGEKRDDKPSGA